MKTVILLVSYIMNKTAVVFKRANKNLLVDDSYQNCKKAKEIGWNVVHFVEDGVKTPRTPACDYQIRDLDELRATFPQLFRSTQTE